MRIILHTGQGESSFYSTALNGNTVRVSTSGNTPSKLAPRRLGM